MNRDTSVQIAVFSDAACFLGLIALKNWGKLCETLGKIALKFV